MSARICHSVSAPRPAGADAGREARLPPDFPRGASDPRAAARVFHDGDCPVCRAEIGWYGTMAGAAAIDWVDIARGPLPEGLDRDRLMRRFTVVRRDGAVVDGARGFVALWRALRPIRWLGVLLDRRPVLPLAEFGYRLFLRIRPLWRSPDRAPDRAPDHAGGARGRGDKGS